MQTYLYMRVECHCRSALHLAARAGAIDVLEVLLEDLEKPDRLEYVNAADKSGITPVFLAKQRSGAGHHIVVHGHYCLCQNTEIRWHMSLLLTRVASPL